MKVSELLKLIEQDGWRFVRQSGSHKIFKHDVKPGILSIPDHGGSRDLKKGTELSIRRKAGI